MFAQERNFSGSFTSVEKNEGRNTEMLTKSLLHFWVLILLFLEKWWQIKLVEVFYMLVSVQANCIHALLAK